MDNSSIMVTIRCLCYNHERYIRKCLEGFVMQKTNFRFEAIVHDDASTDKSADIIREYAIRYPDIIKPIYEQENLYSKNDGSLRRVMDSCTRGKYIAICEGDDYWIDPLKLQKQVDFLESHNDYSMCFHNAIQLFVSSNSISAFNDFREDSDLSVHDAIHKWLVPSASVVLRKEYMEYPEWLTKIYSGDYSLILRCMNGGKIYAFSDYMSVYRVDSGGYSATARMKGKNVFMLNQKIALLESFNKGTNYKFNDEICSRIRYLKEEVEFQQLKEEKSILLLFNLLFYKKLFYKFLNILLKTDIKD